MDHHNLAMDVEDRLYKAKNLIDLCMEYIGTCRGLSLDNLEASLWVAKDLIAEADSKFSLYRTHVKGIKEDEDDDWKEIDKLIEELRASKRDDAGKVGLAVQDAAGNGAGKKVSTKGNKK
jgi:hypothetical protein